MNLKLTFATALIILGTLTSEAQNEKRSETNKVNNKTQPKAKTEIEPQIGTLAKAWKPVVMEHYLGIRGGYGTGSGRFEPLRQTQSYSGLLNFGINYKFDAPEQKYVGCIEIDLNYMEKGFKYETYNESGEIYSRKYTMIELPILWQPYLPLSKKNSSTRFYLSAGPYLGYALNSTEQLYKKEGGTIISEGEYSYISARDNRFEFGVVAGAGIQVAIKRFMIGAEFRYGIMLSDIMKGVNKYPKNPFRSPVDCMNISFGVSYKISTITKITEKKE